MIIISKLIYAKELCTEIKVTPFSIILFITAGIFREYSYVGFCYANCNGAGKA